MVSSGSRLSTGGSSGSGGADQEQRVQKRRDALLDIVKKSIGDDMWDPTGKGSVRIFGNRLVISQTLLGFKLLEESLRTR